MADMTVNPGDVTGAGKRPARFFVPLISAALVVVAAGAGFGLRWLQQYRVIKQEAAKQALAQKVDSIQNVAISGNYNEAQKEIDAALKKPGISSSEKYALLFQQGVTYENEKKYDDAIKSYQSAGVIKDSQEVAEAIARTAEEKGDKSTAVTYYKKAIALISPSDPVGESTKESYELSIKNLGGQP